MNKLLPFLFLSLLSIGNAWAEGVTPGDTGWMMTATAMVLLMTPGLAFFYAGMVRSKNVVSTLFQSYISIGVIGLFWAIAGYSLVFSGDIGGVIGNLNYFMLNGVGPEAKGSIPHSLFMCFQMMFAVITPALITGAFAERINFKSWILFMVIWTLAVYCPVAHWVWGENGWIGNDGGLDFAGGLVVHMTSGYSALALCLLLGKRKDFSSGEHSAYNLAMVFLGTALLVFGWFGFNAGSALAANGLAAHSFTTTFLAASASMVAWVFYDMISTGKTSGMGACIGIVAGLVAITPGAGFVDYKASIFIGLITGFICNLAIRLFKEKFKVDDTLDVFACHGVGGTLGTILTGVFATTAVNPDGGNGLLYGGWKVFKANLVGGIAVALYSIVATFFIYKLLNLILPLRVADEHEEEGLDSSQHGESILTLS